jgi:transposase
VRLIAPHFVKPYVKTHKTDATDAEAICEPVSRPNMRFVPVKSIEQQSALSLHRVRQGFVRARTAQACQIRSLLAEFGLVMPRGIANIKQVPKLLQVAGKELPAPFCRLIERLMGHLKELDRQARELEEQIVDWHQRSEPSRRLAKIPGIGPITASALVASISGVRSFKNGRELAAWLGLVPRQHSSGGKPTLLGISKRGDRYLRTLLVHGARSVIVRVLNARMKRAAGSKGSWSVDTSMSPQSHSLTKPFARCGPCWPTTESTARITNRCLWRHEDEELRSHH